MQFQARQYLIIFPDESKFKILLIFLSLLMESFSKDNKCHGLVYELLIRSGMRHPNFTQNLCIADKNKLREVRRVVEVDAVFKTQQDNKIGDFFARISKQFNEILGPQRNDLTVKIEHYLTEKKPDDLIQKDSLIIFEVKKTLERENFIKLVNLDRYNKIAENYKKKQGFFNGIVYVIIVHDGIWKNRQPAEELTRDLILSRELEKPTAIDPSIFILGDIFVSYAALQKAFEKRPVFSQPVVLEEIMNLSEQLIEA